MSETPRTPVSTYRVQLHREFTFRDAEAVVPYLASLGVTGLYASPYLRARPGSRHGYDISDHASLNPEIGTDKDHAGLVRALREREMEHVVDIVPNHMGIGEPSNRWWMDVLEHGKSSPYADHFDIDWHPLTPELEGRVLLPILGDTFGKVLEAGELRLNRDGGEIYLTYYEHRLPLSPRSLAPLLESAAERVDAPRDDPDRLELESIARSLGTLPSRNRTDPESSGQRHRERAVAARRLTVLVDDSDGIARAVDGAVDDWNGKPGDPASFDRLERLLDDQAYRLAYWRVAAEEINYRRFFDINDLAGVRVERDEVFRDTHRLILDMAEHGRIDGLRIDHPDGLYDPEAYLRTLRRVFTERTGREPYLLVEKILTGEETVPEGWPVAGTVGYDALDRISKAFVDEERLGELTELYRTVTGRGEPFPALAYRKKRLALRSSLASELTVLSDLLTRIARRDRHTRDFTRASLTDAIAETVACFPVYRTYVEADSLEVSERDRRYVQRAIREARRRNPSMSRSVFRFVEDTLLLAWPDDPTPDARADRVRFVMKFQQLTGPVMAKGVEDTTFYVYNRLVSLNEVGGEPAEVSDSVGGLHHFCRRRAEAEPHAMTSTSTHDTKRSEDVRVRIHVLSELTREWSAAVTRWFSLNARHRVTLEDGPCPDPNDEYLLYQTLVGAWPIGTPDDDPTSDFVDRIAAYMEKATREAKERTSWVNPDEGYDAALERFVRLVLDPGRSGDFLDDLRAFVADVELPGMVNALAQVTLKLTIPGVPDIYQGQELWDQSLVDPDNRRAVDYDRRRTALDGIAEADPAELIRSWRDGRVKLWLTHRLLRLRREEPGLFLDGEYRPLEVVGEAARHVVAFGRARGPVHLVVVVPRLLARLGQRSRGRLPAATDWGGTAVRMPGGMIEWRDVLSDRTVEARGGRLRIGSLLDPLPIAVLRADQPPSETEPPM